MRALPETIIAALAQLSKAQPSFEHYLDFDREAGGDRNHRGAGILLATNVENALESALTKFLKPGRADGVFGFNSALGSFANKIYMGYALDIFGDETFRNLEIIRIVRNAFAHAKIPISFDTKEVADAVALTTIPVLMNPVTFGAEEEDFSALTKRDRFREVCRRLAHNLIVQNFVGVIAIDRDALKIFLDDRYSEVTARYPPLP